MNNTITFEYFNELSSISEATITRNGIIGVNAYIRNHCVVTKSYVEIHYMHRSMEHSFEEPIQLE